MSIVLASFGRHTGAATSVLLVGLLAIGGVAAAREVGPPRQKIVALGFDVANDALIEAYPKALYRRANAGRDRERIALPKEIERGRIVSVAIPAHGQGTLYIAGRGFGVLRSADGGRSWIAKNAGLPSRDIVALTAHADQPDTLYVYVNGVNGRGIFRSEDAGGHWRLMDAGPREKILHLIHSNMPGSMQTGWFFAATAKGVDRSMDCFCGWREAGGLARAVNEVAYDPRQPKHVYAAGEAGLFLSTDGGEQWSQLSAPGPGISALAVTLTGELYAAVGEGELFRSIDHGQTWQRIDA